MVDPFYVTHTRAMKKGLKPFVFGGFAILQNVLVCHLYHRYLLYFSFGETS